MKMTGAENTDAELLQCIGLANAMTFIVDRRTNMQKSDQSKADEAIASLAQTLSDRLRDIKSSLHEAYARASVQEMLKGDPAN